MLTNQQKQTIEFLTAQFEKLNASTQQKTKFNLVDIKPLQDKSDKIRQLDEEEKTTEKMWRDIQVNELHRITNLLLEDLPKDRVAVEVNTYGCTLSICRMQYLSNGEVFTNTHPESCVKISVEIKKERYWDEYSQKHRDNYTGICYRLNYGKVEYSTIEELCATDEFKDTLRKRVL